MSLYTPSNNAYLARKLMRSLLREALKFPALSFKHENSKAWRKYKDESNKTETQNLRHLADTYTAMMKNLREHMDLIGIHYKMADQRKSVEMTSKYVGLGIPQWPETEEERKEREKEEAEVMQEHNKLRKLIDDVRSGKQQLDTQTVMNDILDRKRNVDGDENKHNK